MRWFWFAFLWWLAMLKKFSYTCFLCSMSIRVFCPFQIRLFVFLLLSCKDFLLYILDFYYLPDMRFGNRLPLIVSFAMQKLCSFIESHFSFLACAFFITSTNHCWDQHQGAFPLPFRLGILEFQVLYLNI